VTRQLGPLPISAAVVAGLVAAFDPGEIDHKWILWVALGLFGVLVLLSVLYGNMAPYRVLRLRGEEELPEHERPSELLNRILNSPPEPRTNVTELVWYRAMLRLESEIYGKPRGRWPERLSPARVKTLQEGFERERTGLILVQSLFAVVIVLLVLSRVA